MVDRTARYEDLGPLGAGGMGEVRKVRDRELGRVSAMKIIRGELTDDDGARARFADEARMTARLEHPGIIPVYEVGQRPDGRLYYTMPIVRGRTLTESILELHEALLEGRHRGRGGFTFRGLVEVYRRVCEAVAYAHARGIVHGDLKPDNVMTGAHGEVFVLDWGLARVIAPSDPSLELEFVDRETVPDLGVIQEPAPTMAGTPAYMAPERLWEGSAELTRAADVYALGAILYQLMAGAPPYGITDPIAVVQKLASGPPPAPEAVARDRGAPPPPEDLVAVALAGMARDPADRPDDAETLGREVAAWIEGERARERAMQLVGRARETWTECEEVRARAAQRRAEAAAFLASLEPHAAPERKRPAWVREAEADGLEVRAARREADYLQDLRGALALSPELSEAHELLASHHRTEHEAAERAGDAGAVARAASLLEAHDRRGHHRAYLAGEGRLSIRTDPPGARALLYRYREVDRRLKPEYVRALGPSPVVELTLEIGSYMVRLLHPDRAEVQYPVLVRRLDHWDGVPAGARDPAPVRLPPGDALGDGDCYVPAGWFRSGGDPAAPGSLPRRWLWLDGFVMRRDPVTHAELLAFLNDLVEQGLGHAALEFVPRLGGTPTDEAGTPLYGVDPAGRFTLDGGDDRATVAADLPVVCVTWRAASAYAAWRADRDGVPWRLPGELEWEKAARGVDGRAYPWGDHLEPAWCNMRDTRPAEPSIAAVDAHPDDVSPYGVRGLAGNVRDWCADAFRPGGPVLDGDRWVPREPPLEGVPRVGRGGAWCVNPATLRSAYRSWFSPGFVADDSLGFRLVRSWP